MNETVNSSFNKIFVIEGDLNLYNVDRIRKEAIGILENQSFKNFVIDLKKVDYIDSSGIATLNFIQKKAKTFERNMYLINLNDTILESLHLSGLGNYFKIIKKDQ